MIVALLLGALQVGMTQPAPGHGAGAPPVQAAPQVTDWPALPLYPLPRSLTSVDAASYVRAEVEAGRCRAISPIQADGARVIAPMAILVGPGGAIRRIVPRAIDCPTVEQYTVGYFLSATRAVSGSMLPPAPGWYRLTVTYRW